MENWWDDWAQRVVVSGAKSNLKFMTSGTSVGLMLAQ